MADLAMEGRILAQKYELVRLLGQGGMGAVYEARNHLGKRFAVKLLLKPEFSQDQALVTRFFREAKASAAIESEHVVEVFDTGEDPETRFPFIVMELLRGEDLEHTIQRVGALHTVGAARVIFQAAEGLRKAHEHGIVHRDIKPANIFMTMRDSGDALVKILDFGIAKQAMEALQAGQDQGLTKTGSMLGTPLYMSPEQAQGLRTVDGRSDIWSLAMCLYESLSGRTPWGDVETLGQLILSICSRDVTPIQELAPWVPPELALVVHKALQRDVNQRTASAHQLMDELRPFCGGGSTITPDVLIGVEEATRRVTAPRADMGASSSVVLTSSQAGQARGKKSSAPLFIGVGILGLAIIGGGIFAATKLAGAKDDEKPKASATKETTKEKDPETTATPSTKTPPVPTVVDEGPKTGTLTLKMPAGCIVKVDNKPVDVKDGKISLTGPVEKLFYVSVFKGPELLINQKVYMADNFVVPDEIDTAKPAVAVKLPAPGTKPPGATSGAPATTTGPAPTKTAPPKPKGSSEFE